MFLMRFVLYNLRYGTGIGHFQFPWSGYFQNTTRNFARISAFLRQCQPDIVGLIEVDAGSYRSSRRNQAEELAETLGHYHVYELKYARHSPWLRVPVLNKQVNALLTRATIKTRRFHYFDRGVKRLIIELEIDGLTIFLVHLALTFRARHDQLLNLYSLIKPMRTPCIVAGDFNLFLGDKEIHLFLEASGLCNANHNDRGTFPSWRPRRQLDFILHSPDIVVSHFETPAVRYSDHLPLICDFHFRDSPDRAG